MIPQSDFDEASSAYAPAVIDVKYMLMIPQLQDYLVSQYQQGLPSHDIMKKAIERAAELASGYDELKDCNILILNLKQLAATKMELVDVRFQRNFKYNVVFDINFTYGVWVFVSGTVDHTACEGGWNNWSMYGRYKRSGSGNGYVEFEDRRIG